MVRRTLDVIVGGNTNVPDVDAAERVRRRLVEWKEKHGHGAGTTLASAVNGKYGEAMSPQWASGVFTGKNDLRLEHLDAVAELLGVPPGDLVRREKDLYIEVIPTEMMFLRHLRKLPDTVRHQLLHVWDYLFGFQDKLLKEYKDQVDRRTALARRSRGMASDRGRRKNNPT